MGAWAEENLHRLSDDELAAFALVLAEENPDLFKWLTSQLQPPPELEANPAFVMLRQHVSATLAAKAQTQTRSTLGKEWVRGWADSGLPSSGNQQ
jgi:hypothetical protein